MSGSVMGGVRDPRGVMLAITFTLAGAAFYLFVCGGLGWWGDGFFLVMFGMMVGQSVGFTAMAYIPRWSDSDGPFMLGGAAGVLGMATLWLCLSEDTMRGLGRVVRALDGGAVGLLLAYGLAAMSSDSYTPQQDDRRLGEGGAGVTRGR